MATLTSLFVAAFLALAPATDVADADGLQADAPEVRVAVTERGGGGGGGKGNSVTERGGGGGGGGKGNLA